ncbi:MAG: hypothetical protein KY469_12620 [Actinobacteria bacterium]|nr:hypothetical protein [Actinomycetota bacterium]
MRQEHRSFVAAVAVLVSATLQHGALAVADLGTQDDGDLERRLGGADHLVVMGADDPGSPSPPDKADRFEYHAFYPETLRIHRDDVVRFASMGDHTVTFHPGGVRQDSVFVADELPGDVRAEGFLPSRDDCAMGKGRDHLPACVIDSTDQYLNTGVAVANPDFSARIRFSFPPGSYAYFCSFHPEMSGEIEVVDDEVEIATPAEVDAARQAQVAADTAAAEAIVAEFEAAPPRVVDGRRAWEVQVAARTPDRRVEILSFLPVNLTIEPGDEVEFVVDGLDYHTATFIPDHAGPIGTTPVLFLTYFEFRCDPEDRDGGAPGVAVGLPYLLMDERCPDGQLVEFVYGPSAYEEPLSTPGGIVAGPAPTHDSGLIAGPKLECNDSCDPWTGEPLPSTFEASFPQAGSFGYWCGIHLSRGMSANITVDG